MVLLGGLQTPHSCFACTRGGRRATPSQVCSCPPCHPEALQVADIALHPQSARLILHAFAPAAKICSRCSSRQCFSSNASRYACRCSAGKSVLSSFAMSSSQSRKITCMLSPPIQTIFPGPHCGHPVCSTSIPSLYIGKFHLSTPGSLQLSLLCDHPVHRRSRAIAPLPCVITHPAKQLGGSLEPIPCRDSQQGLLLRSEHTQRPARLNRLGLGRRQ